MKSLPLTDQETVIGRCADEDRWEVYSCDRVFVGRMLRLIARARAAGREAEVRGGKVDQFGYRWTVPKRWVSVRMPARRSEAQVEAARNSPMVVSGRGRKGRSGTAPVGSDHLGREGS